METVYEQIRAYIDAHRDEMLELWKKIVNINSGSGNKEGVDKVAQVIADEMEKSGIKAEIFKEENAGNTLVGVWNENAQTEPVVLMGHIDTVFNVPTENGEFRTESGKAFGNGVLDMKAGVVMALYVCKALMESGYDERPVKLIFSGDEEVAHRNSSSAEIMGDAAEGAVAAFNFETGNIDNGIVVGRLGAELFTIETAGVSAHSGNDPEKGRSAIEEMAHKVIEIQKLNDIERGKLVNIGTIRTEGKTNIIPDRCVAQGCFRFKTRAIQKELKEEILEICGRTDVEGTDCTYTMQSVIDCMEPISGNYMLFEHARKVAEKIGYGEVRSIEVGGGSDSSVTTFRNIPTICGVGVCGEFNHTEREYAVIESLFERCVWIACTVASLGDMTEMN